MPEPSPRHDSSTPAPGSRELSFSVSAGHVEPERSYRHQINPGESVAEAFRRVCMAELTRAAAALESGDRAQGIHTARKATKRTRAMLRLVRDQVGEAAYRTENVALRDAGRALSEARSAYVVARTAEQLAATLPLVLPPAAGADLVARLDTRRAAVEARVLGDAAVGGTAREAILHSKSRIELWAFEDPDHGYLPGPALPLPDTFESIGWGLRRVYRRGRRAMRRAYAEPSTETFHEWRKRVRYLRYQVEALHLMWPSLLGELADELTVLAETLGTEHDLAELAALVEDDSSLLPHAGHRSELLRVAGEQRRALQESARGMGRRVYAERPAPFVARLETSWEAWRQE